MRTTHHSLIGCHVIDLAARVTLLTITMCGASLRLWCAWLDARGLFTPCSLAQHPHTKGVLQGRVSTMIIGPPNTGKTTVLRELARLLAEDRSRVVAVVDKSLEIAGSGDIPHDSVSTPASLGSIILTSMMPINYH